MKTFLPPVNIPRTHYDTLQALARQCLHDCRCQAHDGTVLFRPDSGGHYDAQWTRDLCYMVEGAGTLMDPGEVLGAIDYLLAGQRQDGVVPDRRCADGTSVYLAGPVEQPLGDSPPADNGPFLAKLLAAYARMSGDHEGFLARLDAVYRAMDAVPLSPDGLVIIDRNRPHPGYGFTDCVAKTGYDFFCSVLYWEACQVTARTLARAEHHDEAHEWYERAESCSHHLGDLWDETVGMFRAASEDCHQVDLWASAYACVVRVASRTQARRIAGYFLEHQQQCMLAGHLRHLPAPETWQRLLTDVPAGTYQNGGYWAAPSGWLIQTVSLVDEAAARRMVTELVGEFSQNGVHEWISPQERQVPGYVASIANVLGAVQPSARLSVQETNNRDATGV